MYGNLCTLHPILILQNDKKNDLSVTPVLGFIKQKQNVVLFYHHLYSEDLWFVQIFLDGPDYC